jgi:hypothetical protein
MQLRVYFLLLPLLFFACDRMHSTSKISDLLPSTATQVQEYFNPSGFGDFNYMMSANISRSEYESFVKHVGLLDQYSERKYGIHRSTLNKSFSNKPSWWIQRDIVSDDYVRYDPTEERLEYAKYFDGRLFYLRSRW